MAGYRHLFGPVPSRRLGLSLGVDLVPAKTCSYDCVFCQIGRTPTPTLARAAFVPPAAVLAEFDAWLAAGGRADHITLAGAGEPTLHTGFGDVLAGIRARTDTPTVLMSNGSLFFLPEVRAAARLASIVKVSWSGWDEPSWRRVNRPAPGLSYERVAAGIRSFAADYTGPLWVEVFVVPGVNDGPAALARIAACVNPLRAARVHLNTATRPPADGDVRAAPTGRLRDWAGLFDPPAEVPEEGPGAAGAGAGGGLLETVLRHPATAPQLARALGRGAAEVAAELEALARAGRVAHAVRADGVWYGPPLPDGR